MSDDPRHLAGRRGEAIAARYMRQRGFHTVARNARSRFGEIDLIACDGATLVFVEVKTRRIGSRSRSPREDQLPLSGLGPRQRVRLRRLASAWLAQQRPRPRAQTIRFDAIGVLLGADGQAQAIEHVEGAW